MIYPGEADPHVGPPIDHRWDARGLGLGGVVYVLLRGLVTYVTPCFCEEVFELTGDETEGVV